MLLSGKVEFVDLINVYLCIMQGFASYLFCFLSSISILETSIFELFIINLDKIILPLFPLIILVTLDVTLSNKSEFSMLTTQLSLESGPRIPVQYTIFPTSNKNISAVHCCQIKRFL